MISGTITVESSDNASFVAGTTYPITIDDSQVDVSVVTTSVVSVTGEAASDTTTQEGTPDTSGNDDGTGGQNDQPVEASVSA